MKLKIKYYYAVVNKLVAYGEWMNEWFWGDEKVKLWSDKWVGFEWVRWVAICFVGNIAKTYKMNNNNNIEEIRREQKVITRGP